jgi:molybdopterin-guanine dinucleotide biosynthesis protein B
MNRVHVIGGKNHGKTTLIEELVKEFTARGLRVGTIKHTHHHHELDVPGKDSYRHREAGAVVVGILSRSMNALFWSGEHSSEDARYQDFAEAFSDCHVVLVEGDTPSTAPKVEVWRAELNTPPLALRIENVRAIITADKMDCGLPLLPRSDISSIANFIARIVAE